VQDDTHSFVVRIWHEALNSEGHIVAWRGFADHVSSGERCHFEDLKQLVGFIQTKVGLDEGRSSSQQRASISGKRE